MTRLLDLLACCLILASGGSAMTGLMLAADGRLLPAAVAVCVGAVLYAAGLRLEAPAYSCISKRTR